MPGRVLATLCVTAAIVVVVYDTNTANAPARKSEFYAQCTNQYDGPLCLDPMSPLLIHPMNVSVFYAGSNMYLSNASNTDDLCVLGCSLTCDPMVSSSFRWFLFGPDNCSCDNASCDDHYLSCPTTVPQQNQEWHAVCANNEFSLQNDCAYSCAQKLRQALNFSCTRVECLVDGEVVCDTPTESYSWSQSICGIAGDES